MTAHWIYALPIAMGFLIKNAPIRFRKYLIGIVAAIALYLIIYNGSLIVGFFS